VPGSGGETRQTNYGLERAELIEIEAAHQSILFIGMIKSFNFTVG
jgi:hypothetical protein